MKESHDLNPVNRSLEAFKKLVPHLRGSLWWGADEIIHEKQSTFVRREDREEHPLLSLLNEEVRSAGDVIPMLFGTSGGGLYPRERSLCIVITGMTRREPVKPTYFGSVVEPGLYEVSTMMDSVRPQKFAHRRMHPNWDKARADAAELLEIERFCKAHDL